MVPFKYIDFYDVPRFLLLKYRDHLFLLASYFDEEKDDYDDNYSIDILPSWVEQICRWYTQSKSDLEFHYLFITCV
jgi:hypothetical protein